MLANPVDFAPGVNFEPWFRYHGRSRRVGRLSAFLTAEPDRRWPCSTHCAPLGGGPATRTDRTRPLDGYLARAGYGYQLVDERTCGRVG